MKRLVILLVVVVLILAMSAPAFAFGAKPGAHADSGREFGEAVAASAMSDPFNFARHVGGRLPF